MGRLFSVAVVLASADLIVWLVWVALWGPSLFGGQAGYGRTTFLSAIQLLVCVAILSLVDYLRIGRRQPVVQRSTSSVKVSVAIPAYNEEENIEYIVKDFLSHPSVEEVIIVDNNSADRTGELAEKSGARVVREPKQGYGYACMTGLRSAKSDVVILVEADKTQTSADIPKFLAYLENADMVVGTRTTLELVEPGANMDPFLKIGNTFLAKLIQVRFWGRIRLTDVGCTYRAIWRSSLEKIVDQFTVGGSHFSPEMIITALKEGLRVIEIPISYRCRGGVSKITGASKWKSFKVGLQMLRLIFTT